ncbi:MAG TPA: hypothetical protein VEZ12_14120 [Herpetosiphonaceae bacterium]|nr:hypothetical protein [Herpetosiphonaceae bacterium]
MMSPVQMRFILLSAAVISSGCASRGGPTDERRTTEMLVGREVRQSDRPGVIARSRLADVVPQIAALRVEPAELALVVGQSFAFDSLRVHAYDASGQEMGLLPVYDREMRPGAAVLNGVGGIQANSPGESVLTLTPPLWERYGGGRVAPTAQLRVRVSGR